ncbi:MAG: DUF3352 domain-containing protein [Candidatus Sumerlaeia bacterium]|nr:DUF3352 domain-containing protein [Candidatus Sumerlaeia bacterium]
MVWQVVIHRGQQVFFLLLGLAVCRAAPAASVRTFSDPRALPPEAVLVLSVPDLAGAWKALAAAPIYGDVAAILNSPVPTGFSPLDLFLAKKRRMEAALGFPLDASTLPAILWGIDFAFLPPPNRQGRSGAVFIFRVADPVRFRRLADYAIHRMAEVAQHAGLRLEQSDYQQVRILATDAGIGMAVAELTPERFVLANHADAIRRIVDQCRKPAALDSEVRYRAAIGGLTEPRLHGFLYLNSPQPIPGLWLLGVNPGGSSGIALAAGMRIEKEAIRLESFLPLGDPSRDPLSALYQAYPPARLRVLDAVSSAPMAVVARNTLDGPALYDLFRAMTLESFRAVAPPGRNPEQRLQMSEDSFRAQMGFALREDLAAAIGPEVFISLDTVGFDPLQLLPFFDLAAGIQVRDDARMETVLRGFERFMEKQYGAGAPVARPAPAIQTLSYQGGMIRSFAFPPVPIFSIAYGRGGNYLLAGVGTESVQRAMDRLDGRQRSFYSGMLYAALAPYLHNQCNDLIVMDVRKVVAVAGNIIRRLPKADAAQIEQMGQVERWLSRLNRIAAIAASTAGTEAGLHTRGVVLFGPPLASPAPKTAKR